MRKKRRPAKSPLSEKTRASDERLREALRSADLKKFDRALANAIKPPTKREVHHG
jgi:hypothetical protein